MAVAGVTGAVRVLGTAPGPVAHHRPAAPIVYAAYTNGGGKLSEVIPVSTATNTPGTPIHVPLWGPDTIAITP